MPTLESWRSSWMTLARKAKAKRSIGRQCENDSPSWRPKLFWSWLGPLRALASDYLQCTSDDRSLGCEEQRGEDSGNWPVLDNHLEDSSIARAVSQSVHPSPWPQKLLSAIGFLAKSLASESVRASVHHVSSHPFFLNIIMAVLVEQDLSLLA